ncbi:MAG: SWIM zinc finger family protein [Xanthobacteraceae bacterium]
MSYFGIGWRDYVSAVEKRRRAEIKVAELKKQGRPIAPLEIKGRTIARSFWGQSWCSNLERYSDFESRLPRGRSYVRNGSVVDLQITKGEVAAMVSGSELYQIRITISPVAGKRWRAICRDCAGTIDSLVELLQGRLAKGVMDRVCREGDGLFPAPNEIKLSCSCPDWADMCKHVAAALYGVGARIDEKPQLLFVLRGVDEKDLLAWARQDLPLKRTPPSGAKVLENSNVAALFGLEIAESANSETSTAVAPKRQPRSEMLRRNGRLAVKTAMAAKKSNSSRAVRSKSKPKPKRTTLASARKRRAQQRQPQGSG